MKINRGARPGRRQLRRLGDEARRGRRRLNLGKKTSGAHGGWGTEGHQRGGVECGSGVWIHRRGLNVRAVPTVFVPKLHQDVPMTVLIPLAVAEQNLASELAKLVLQLVQGVLPEFLENGLSRLVPADGPRIAPP